MRIGILTGGGDCPGLNPAIRGFVLKAEQDGHTVLGFLNGWKGLVKGDCKPIGLADVEDIINQGGTMLGSSRTNPFKKGAEADLQKTLENIKKFQLDAVVALGGEDTLGVAHKLFKLGVPTVGVPKTMDNDLQATDFTFGFDSAVEVAVDAIDRLRDTARSHSRVIVVEVMGRHAGWVALYAGVAGGADWILVPEQTVDLDAMCAHLKAVRARGKNYSIVVASEGAEFPEQEEGEKVLDAFGHATLKERNVGDYLAKLVEEKTGFETRHVVLGHIVRGGPPSAFDRVLASRVGIKAAEMVSAGEFGKMAALQGTEVVAVDLGEAVAKLKTVPDSLIEDTQVLYSR